MLVTQSLSLYKLTFGHLTFSLVSMFYDHIHNIPNAFFRFRPTMHFRHYRRDLTNIVFISQYWTTDNRFYRFEPNWFMNRFDLVGFAILPILPILTDSTDSYRFLLILTNTYRYFPIHESIRFGRLCDSTNLTAS